MEAIEAGAAVLLVDEDTSATNFMIRDRRMRALVANRHEPITPLVDRISELNGALGLSVVLVMGGSGDYFDRADTVIHMKEYQPLNVTDAAFEIARAHPTEQAQGNPPPLCAPQPRVLDPRSLAPEVRPGRRKIQARGLDTLLFGRGAVDLRAVEQVVDPCQVRSIGWLLARLAEFGDRETEPLVPLESWLGRLAGGEWDWLTGRPDGDLSLPRPLDAMAVLNRLRGVRFRKA
jgi:predicted ABC-class ATPase